MPCTRVIIAAGAWSPEAFRTLFRNSDMTELPISSLAGHSLVVTSPRWAEADEERGCHAVFVAKSGAGYSPEIVSRLGGQLYIGGLNSPVIPLPRLPSDHGVSAASIAVLRQAASEMLGRPDGEDDLEVVRAALCFRPVTPWGTPILSRIQDDDLGTGFRTRPGAEGGVFLASGHGPWGISMSLGTGKVVAELVQGRKLSADISSLSF